MTDEQITSYLHSHDWSISGSDLVRYVLNTSPQIRYSEYEDGYYIMETDDGNEYKVKILTNNLN